VGQKSADPGGDGPAYEYARARTNYEKLIRDYLFNINFSIPPRDLWSKAGPSSSSSETTGRFDTAGRVRMINRQEHARRLRRPLSVGFSSATEKCRGERGSDDNHIGWRYARTGCQRLGARSLTP